MEDPEPRSEGPAVTESAAGGVAGSSDPGIMVGGGTGFVKQGTSLVICCVLLGEL